MKLDVNQLMALLQSLGVVPDPDLSAACLTLAVLIHEKHANPADAREIWMDRCTRAWDWIEQTNRERAALADLEARV